MTMFAVETGSHAVAVAAEWTALYSQFRWRSHRAKHIVKRIWGVHAYASIHQIHNVEVSQSTKYNTKLNQHATQLTTKLDVRAWCEKSRRDPSKRSREIMTFINSLTFLLFRLESALNSHNDCWKSISNNAYDSRLFSAKKGHTQILMMHHILCYIHNSNQFIPERHSN